MAENEKEIHQLQQRLRDLADKSYHQNTYTFTGFLGMSDQAVFFDMERELSFAGYSLFGGSEICERKVLRFGSEENMGYVEEYPIVLLRVEPLMQKFADNLSHRDFLGAIMNLGIERSTIGDIFILENKGYVFCLETIAEYLMQSLDKVKHTSVRCVRTSAEKEPALAHQEMVRKELTVASERIDVIISKLYNLSRTDSLELFRAGKIFINGRTGTSNSYFLKKGDAISVRGYGKFVYDGFDRETRKGKLSVGVLVYGTSGN